MKKYIITLVFLLSLADISFLLSQIREQLLQMQRSQYIKQETMNRNVKNEQLIVQPIVQPVLKPIVEPRTIEEEKQIQKKIEQQKDAIKKSGMIIPDA